MSEVIRAERAGACYGVKRALEIANDALTGTDDISTLGPLIHNPAVVAKLGSLGLKMADHPEDVTTSSVIIRSHGALPSELRDLKNRDITIIDATCPHVARAQSAAAELAADGCHVLVVGEEGHPEVEGIKSFANEAGAQVNVVLDPADIPDNISDKVGIVVQTTQKIENLDRIVDALERRGLKPDIRNTICSATTKRQASAESLAQQVDAMVVIGGRNSSNTTRLAEICHEHCENTYHIESSAELKEEEFRRFSRVGVSAGASTPEDQIQEVIDKIESFG